jgi:hypothetical protein
MLILTNIPLVKSLASSFVWDGPAPRPNYDELYGFGLEGLWRASRRIHAITHDGIGGYLAVWIRGAMRRRARQHHITHGRGPIEQYELDQRPTLDESAVVDQWELILNACHDVVDRKICELRRQNEPLASIGTNLHLSAPTVWRRLKAIEKRMDAANAAREKRLSSFCCGSLRADIRAVGLV